MSATRKLMPLQMALGIALLGVTILAQDHNFIPKNGYVPDEKTAVAVAEAVLVPIYGEQTIVHERPFHAVLDSRHMIWTVEGSIPSGSVGGVATVKLQKQDGRIISVTHGK